MSSLSSIYIKKETLRTLLDVLEKKGDNGIEITVSTNDDTNDYGQNISAYVSQTKEQREAGKPKFYVNNCLDHSEVDFTEKYTPVNGFENEYEINMYGDIKNKPKEYAISDNRVFKHKKIIRKKSNDKDGYEVLTINKDGKKYLKKVHRLVAQTFIPNPEGKRTVNHINGIKNDNFIGNLEWATHSENIIHSIEVLGRKTTKGYKLSRYGKHGNSKPILQLDLSGNLIKEWESATQVRDFLGFDNSSINKCCKGTKEATYGYKWKFKLNNN